MIIDCISDLHGYYPKLEGGDVLIVSGDLTATHTPIETVLFIDWLEKQEYRKIIFIAGNHDTQLVENDEYEVFFDGKIFNIKWSEKIEYLCDSGTEFDGLKIWGSPWSLWFSGINPKCTAFTGSEKILSESYDKIPKDTDILITHTPAHRILDKCKNGHVGSIALHGWLKYVGRPRLHCCGHIHEGYGQKQVFSTKNDKMMLSVNCSIVNENYEHVNEPIRVIL
jgi:Icc-related predicted phosphoesterase